MSVNTRELGFQQRWFCTTPIVTTTTRPTRRKILGRPHLIVPYSLVVNDVRYIVGTGFANPEDFFQTAQGDARPAAKTTVTTPVALCRSVSHPRVTGTPARSDGMARFIAYAQQFSDVVFHAPSRHRPELRRTVPASQALAL